MVYKTKVMIEEILIYYNIRQCIDLQSIRLGVISKEINR